MRIKLALIALLVGSGIAYGQYSKSTVNSQINSQFPDQNTGQITPATTRTFLSNLVASYQQYTGVNPQVGTIYAIQTSDYGQVLTFNNSSAVAVTISAPNSTGFNPFNVYVSNISSGNVTITPNASTINGAASFVLAQNQDVWVVSDGSNYQVWNKTTPTWINPTGFTGTFSFVNNTANRTYTFPDATTTIPGLSVANIFTALQTFTVANQFQANFKSSGSNSSFINIDTGAANQQAGFNLNDNSVAKWAFFKGTDQTFNIYDQVNTVYAMQTVPGTAGVANITWPYTLDASSTISAANVFSGGLAVAKGIYVGNGIVISAGNVNATGGLFRATYGTPTIASGACGTGSNGTITSGSNQTGLVTIGASATATCTISFSGTLSFAPAACVIFPHNSAAAATGTTAAYVSSISTSQWIITGTLANTSYYYHCL